MNLNIKFSELQKGKLNTEIRKLIGKQKNIKQTLFSIGDDAVAYMQSFIETNTNKRPKSPHSDTNPRASKSPIAESIHIEKFDDVSTFGWGIGNIDLLNEKSPHWAVINFGGVVPPSTDQYPKLKGHFEPETNGLFKKYSKGSPHYPIYPTKAIEGINYIQATAEFLRKAFARLENIVRRP